MIKRTMPMLVALLAFMIVGSTSPATGNEPMFRCDDGTFTNVADRL